MMSAKSLGFIFFAFLIPTLLITLFFKYFPEHVLGIDLNYSSKVYLILISSVTLITFFIKCILTAINNWINHDKTNDRKKSQLELALSLANKNRIRFTIYLTFFCYLITYSIARLNSYDLFEQPNVDLAIFYSFVTFIALERVSSNIKLLNFNPKSFLQKAINSWESHDYFDKVKREQEEEKDKSQ